MHIRVLLAVELASEAAVETVETVVASWLILVSEAAVEAAVEAVVVASWLILRTASPLLAQTAVQKLQSCVGARW